MGKALGFITNDFQILSRAVMPNRLFLKGPSGLVH